MQGADIRRQIADTFFGLLGKKKIEKITVTDLVRACGISRQTFYYYFRDTMDVAEWILTGKMEQALKECLCARNEKESVRILVCSFIENQDILQLMMRSERKEELERMVIRQTRSMIQKLAGETPGIRSLSAGDANAVMDFYACGFVRFMVMHISRNELDEEKLTDQVFRILNGSLRLF